MHLHGTIERTRQARLKLSYDQCVIKTKSSHFFGNIYIPQGVIPDQSHQKDAGSTNQARTTIFLGMVNNLSQFIKEMSQLTHKMRLVLRKGVSFYWTERHVDNFQRLKGSTSSDACLMYFDTSKPVTLWVDASQVC